MYLKTSEERKGRLTGSVSWVKILGGGGTPLQEAHRDVMLDGVTFS